MTNTFIKVEHNCLEASSHSFEKPTVQTNKVISKKSTQPLSTSSSTTRAINKTHNDIQRVKVIII